MRLWCTPKVRWSATCVGAMVHCSKSPVWMIREPIPQKVAYHTPGGQSFSLNSLWKGCKQHNRLVFFFFFFCRCFPCHLLLFPEGSCMHTCGSWFRWVVGSERYWSFMNDRICINVNWEVLFLAIFPSVLHCKLMPWKGWYQQNKTMWMLKLIKIQHQIEKFCANSWCLNTTGETSLLQLVALKQTLDTVRWKLSQHSKSFKKNISTGHIPTFLINSCVLHSLDLFHGHSR